MDLNYTLFVACCATPYSEQRIMVSRRFSGIESVLRLFAETDSLEKAQELLDYLKQFVAV